MAVEVAERDADGEATEAEMAVARAAAWEGRREFWAPQSHFAAWATNRNVLAAVFNATRHTEPALQCHVLRELFGPSIYRPSSPARVTWNDTTVRSIAQGIYDERRFEDMPILADALADAGCDDEGLLAHCRSDRPHVRGCFLLDLLLGKE